MRIKLHVAYRGEHNTCLDNNHPYGLPHPEPSQGPSFCMRNAYFCGDTSKIAT